MTKKQCFHFDNVYMDANQTIGPFRLLQVGDMAADNNYVCIPHEQVVVEISYCVSGSAVFMADEAAYPVKKGELIITPQERIHAIYADPDTDFRYYYLGFTIIDASRPEEQMLSDFFADPPAHPVAADKAVPAAFQDIFRNILNRDLFSDRMMEDAIRKVLVCTLRSFQRDTDTVYLPEPEPEKNRLLSQICTYLDESIEDIDALKKLPCHFQYSFSYLSSLFSRAMGVSLREYFLQRRHELACDLLSHGMQVTQVSERLGYSSIHVFSHAFSVREGISPTKYITQKENAQ